LYRFKLFQFNHLPLALIALSLSSCKPAITQIDSGFLATSTTTVASSATPTVAITSPAASSYVNNATKAAFTISGTCSESGRTVTVTFGSVTGTPTCSGGNTFSTTLNVTAVSDATVIATADMTDSSGIVATQSTRSFIKDVAAPATPTVALQSPGTSPSSDTVPTLRVGNIVSGLSVKLFSDACSTQTGSTGSSSGTTLDIDTSTLWNGNSYTFYANATDAAGNSSACSLGVAYAVTTAPSGSPLATNGDSACGGGTIDATVGAHSSVVSIERLSGSWSHSCTGVLLSSNRVLTAFHCVDGANLNAVRVVAGLHDRSDYTGTQISAVTSYVSPQSGDPGYISGGKNDIAILVLTTDILQVGNVSMATLPVDNSNLFTGTNISSTYGWWRISAASTIPNILQCGGGYPILSAVNADAYLSGVYDPLDAGEITFYDPANNFMNGAGGSGAPIFVDDGAGGLLLAGIKTNFVQSGGTMNPSYPVIGTRIGYYRDWIAANL